MFLPQFLILSFPFPWGVRRRIITFRSASDVNKFFAVLSDKSQQRMKRSDIFFCENQSTTRSDAKGEFSKFFTFLSLQLLVARWQPFLLLDKVLYIFSPLPRRHFNKIYFIMLIASRSFSPFHIVLKTFIVVSSPTPQTLPPALSQSNGKEAI